MLYFFFKAKQKSTSPERTENTEDDMLEYKEKVLVDKVMDVESRSRRNSLKIVNLPEGANGQDPCLFFKKWQPEALCIVMLQTLLMADQGEATTLHVVFSSFLNHRDKLAVFSAAQAKEGHLSQDKTSTALPRPGQ